MNNLTRRDLLGAVAVAGASVRLGGSAEQPAAARSAEDKRRDRERIVAAGLTDAEAECWELVADAAGAFFRLPVLHPSDEDEVAQAVHVIQHKLLSRPTYRRYLELARAKD